MFRKSALVFVLAALAAAPAAAQDEPAVSFRIGGGFTTDTSISSDHFGDGGNFSAGVYARTGSAVSLGAEYGWNGFGTKTTQFTVTPQPTVTPSDSTSTGTLADFTYRSNIQYGAFNVLVHPNTSGKVKPFFIGGVGAYYRPVKIESSATGYLTACDPVLYMCYPTPTAVSSVVGTHSSTDVGINVGGGVDFKFAGHAAVFFEARYHYIWGPSAANTNVATGTSSATKLNGEFVPITFGLRF